MRILLVGAGGVGSAFCAIAARRDFFETVVPMSDPSYMGEGDKANLDSMQRWASDPGLLGSDNLVVLITEHLSPYILDPLVQIVDPTVLPQLRRVANFTKKVMKA